MCEYQTEYQTIRVCLFLATIIYACAAEKGTN